MEGFDGAGQSAEEAGPVDTVQRTPSGSVGSDTAGGFLRTALSEVIRRCVLCHFSIWSDSAWEC